MRILETDRDPVDEELAALSEQAGGPDEQVQREVREIIADVRARGDAALLELGKKFDSPLLETLQVEEAEFDEAYAAISPDLLRAIQKARCNIEAYHRRQMANSWVEMGEEITRGLLVRPIDKVGLYAPAGLAPYPSTVLMTAVPAAVAGVKDVTICSPVQKDGKMHGPMLVAARECGVGRVFKVSGAQAVAAMAFGTSSVPKVDKIFGPGGAYVTEAKRQVFGFVGVDKLAGPSDILVLADETANPAYVAADLISQAEHGPDSPCVLVTTSRRLADATLTEIRKQTETAARKQYITKSLDTLGLVVIGHSLDECIDLANAFAPEHLEIAVAQPWEVLGKIRNAGTILLGNYSPVPLGDFAAGPNHTLPTGGTARFSSPLGVDDFVKKSGLLSCTQKALREIAPTVLELAQAEGFEAHANAIRIRLEDR